MTATVASVASIVDSTGNGSPRRTGVRVLSLKRQITNAIAKQKSRKFTSKDRSKTKRRGEAKDAVKEERASQKSRSSRRRKEEKKHSARKRSGSTRRQQSVKPVTVKDSQGVAIDQRIDVLV